MTDPIRVLDWMEASKTGGAVADPPEWLIANGLGGYACGTVSGLITRRYHGTLIAAMPVPLGRVIMLDLLVEAVRLPDGRRVHLDAGQITDDKSAPEAGKLVEFRLENGLPVWLFAIDGVKLERRLVLVHGQNTSIVSWRLQTGSEAVQLEVRPFTHFRVNEARVSETTNANYTLSTRGNHHEISAGEAFPALRLQVSADEQTFTLDGGKRHQLYYSWEAKRGYDCRGTLWSPGFFTFALREGRDAFLTASTEEWETISSLMPAEVLAQEVTRRRRLMANALPALREPPADELVLAADTFVIAPPRREPHVLATDGDPYRTVIAGYHWFTDWGRDTMISLEGLTLVTGRHQEARGILRNFAQHIRDGLIPNLFPEHDNEGVYNTADATLWFFHALDRYVETTGDHALLNEMLPRLIDIVRHHLRGTRFGIGVDHNDGLLRQGAEGYQLTWMDAKVDDWVVTPRRGKAVEINALWYNALRLLAGWLGEKQAASDLPPLNELAETVFRSFNRRFWYAQGGHLFDVVDGERGDDPSCRPNQIFSFSLKHPVLDPSRWRPVLDVVEQRLLTPVGLRSLSQDDPDYKSEYTGDLRSRDAAYHQGTVWSWLIGPFIDAWMKLNPGNPERARQYLSGLQPHLNQACLGTISEIFDAEPPFAPRGCVAQAWSVAEFLRCWVKTAPRL